AENYAPIKLRNSIIPICNIGSTLSIPIILLGFFLASRVASFFSILITIGILLYATVFVFQLVTLPVEFNASRRAIKVIGETNLLYDEEVTGAKKVLGAAAMTYVAAMLVSLANLLRIIIRFSGRRN
ncbi:MAG: zinc metallopeptidase, partial [Clostridia bacterium]|nr:zinc metallopeptidase [Clostridia bacterium]